LRKFLSGKREELISELEKEMWGSSSSEDYEKAALLRDIVQGLQRIRQAQKVVLVKGGDLDAIHLSEDGEDATVVKVRDGRVVDVVSFSLEGEEPLWDPMLDFISSFYAISGFIPDVIVTGRRGLDPERREELERFLWKKKGKRVRVIWGRGEEKRSLLEMARRNSKLFRMEREKGLEKEEALIVLRDRLNLTRIPFLIEGFDISHLGGTVTVASMVQFRDAKPRKSGYRRFRIRTAENDDYRSMKEAVSRRYRRVLDQGEDMPDLILIDGGKGQLNAAIEVLRDLDLESLPDIISLAKREEEIFKPGSAVPIVLKRTDPSLKLLQRIRDESHRFALAYQRKLREKEMTILTEVEGIGKARARKLLHSFSSLEDIVNSGPDAVFERCSIPIEVSDNLIKFLVEHMKRSDKLP
jgi:excinuclease ABC subunit C